MLKTQFEKLEVYRISKVLADRIWYIVEQWSSFDKDTLGVQLLRSSDSIGENISKGLGIGNYDDAIKFAKDARASLFKTKHWVQKAYRHQLISEPQINELKILMEKLSPIINFYINPKA